MTQATWLVDKSALGRAGVPAVGQALEWRLRRGLLAVSIVTELEIGFSAQSVAGHQLMRRTVVDRLIPVALRLLKSATLYGRVGRHNARAAPRIARHLAEFHAVAATGSARLSRSATMTSWASAHSKPPPRASP